MSSSRDTKKSSAVSVLCALLFMQVAVPGGAYAETLRWTRTYNGTANGFDSGQAVAVGPDGSVYLAGGTATSSSSDTLLQKYSPGGVRGWTRTYHGATKLRNYAYGMAVGRDGSIFVTGCTGSPGAYNTLLQNYSPAGVFRWRRVYNRPVITDDCGLGVAVGREGSIYVVGYTGASGSPSDLLLQKNSPNGLRGWTRTYNGPANGFDSGRNAAVGPDGAIYVVGTTGVASLSTDLLLQKYSPSGVRLWTRTYNGAANGLDDGYGVAIGRDGSIYVVGSTQGPGPSTDLLLQKYSPAGTRRWTRTYGGLANGYHVGYGIAIGPDGSLYVAGLTFENASHLLLQKYSPTGIRRWTKIYAPTVGSKTLGNAVAVAPDGGIYVAGRIYIPTQDWNALLQKYR